MLQGNTSLSAGFEVHTIECNGNIPLLNVQRNNSWRKSLRQPFTSQTFFVFSQAGAKLMKNRRRNTFIFEAKKDTGAARISVLTSVRSHPIAHVDSFTPVGSHPMIGSHPFPPRYMQINSHIAGKNVYERNIFMYNVCQINKKARAVVDSISES